jgi:riboflavin kinase/FMN adenylyltransferase
MKVYEKISELGAQKRSFAIGVFDGVHRGHQQIFQVLKQLSNEPSILTFKEHPLTALRPPAPLTLTPLPLKLRLLEQFGIKHVVVIDFKEVQDLSYTEFLQALPLSHLVRGKGSHLGKNREGNEENVKKWGKEKNVEMIFIDLLESISSSMIRSAILSKDFAKAELLLGHNYYEKII